MWAPIIAAGVSAAGSIIGGAMNKGGSKETKIQKQQRYMIDDLIRSLRGQGPYSDLYATDENAFNKSFVEPAQQRFRNQIAPQIQQSYIASGQQRGSGLDDQLLRAGVDMNSMLDQYYLDFVNQAQNRKSSTIANILGQSAGATPPMSTGQAFGQSAAGYLASPAFGQAVNSIGDAYTKWSANQPVAGSGYNAGMNAALNPPHGFAPN